MSTRKVPDRNEVVFGPVSLDPLTLQKEVDTLVNESTTQREAIVELATAVENIAPTVTVPAVQGYGGLIVGLPPGTPAVYVPPNLLAYPATLIGNAGVGSAFGAVAIADTGNEFGLGVNTAVFFQDNAGSTSDRMWAFNGTNSTASAILPTGLGSAAGDIWGMAAFPNGILMQRIISQNSAGAHQTWFYSSGTFNSITLNPPATGTWYIRAYGPASNGTDIIAVWGQSTSVNTEIRTYDTSGTFLSSITANLPTGNTWSIASGTVSYDVRNGGILVKTGNSTSIPIVMRAATVSASNWYAITPSAAAVANTSSQHGMHAAGTTAWARESDTLFEIDVTTGNYTEHTFILTGFTAGIRGIKRISDTQVAWMCLSTDGTNIWPTYCLYDASTGYPGSISYVDILEGMAGTLDLTSTPTYSGNHRLSGVCTIPANGSKSFIAGLDGTSPNVDTGYVFNVT